MDNPQSVHADATALADIFTRLGRELSGERSSDDVFDIMVTRAYEVVPAAEHAAVSRGVRGHFETVAATSELPPKVDQIQYELGHGPCVDAILDASSYLIDDLTTSEKWPEYGRRASAEYGIRSMLSVRMYLEDDDVLAGLNLYSSTVGAFDRSDRTTATLLATHGAIALTAARRQDKIVNLERALKTSRQIGTAIGILMATHKFTSDQAFDLLRIASQNMHRKLADIADEVVLTGALALPDVPESRRRG